jgi:hypothetical protein
VKIKHRNANLLEIVLALRSSRRFARCLYRWQQQSNQYANDRDYDEEFDQSEPGASTIVAAQIELMIHSRTSAFYDGVVRASLKLRPAPLSLFGDN